MGGKRESDWVRMMLHGWCIGWQTRGRGEGMGWGDRSDLKLTCSLFSSYPCPASFMSQPRVNLPAAPDGAVCLGLPSTGCAPLTPTTTELYSLNWFQGRRPSLCLCFTHTQTHTNTHLHTYTDSLPTASAPSAHTHTRGWRCALSTLIQFETRQCD